MSLISSYLPAFVNGISQQPYTLRLNTQGELQENGISTVAQGLRKRPPTTHLAKIGSSPISDTFIHTINRDATERYVVMVLGGSLYIFTVAGVPCVVNYAAGAAAYLSAPSYATSFSAISVADYTFIVNKTVVVANSTTLTASSPNPYEALINVKTGNYAKTYTITINGSVVASYTTPDGSNANQGSQIATNYIANSLSAGLTAAGISFQTVNGAIYIYSSSDFTISCDDGFGNNSMVVIKGKTQNFSDLPDSCSENGVIIEIQGSDTTSFSSYYVKFIQTVGGSNGVWQECAASGIISGVDPATMPHKLTREPDGTFLFAPANWTTRQVGDLVSNSDPSCVSRTISDVFFHQNRLGFLSDENCILSGSADYFNLYRTTITALIASDVIDVTAMNTSVSLLRHAVPFNKTLLLFSDQTQFLVPAAVSLSPTTMAIQVSTQFPCDTNVKPFVAGRTCYFTTTKGQWEAVREYSVNNYLGNEDAIEITAHVPTYIPAGIYKIAGCNNEDTFVALTNGDKGSMYVYKYFYTSSNEKSQSSWSRWTLDDDDVILNAEFIQSILYMVISRPEGVFFESIDFSTGYIGSGEPFTVYLDRKLMVTPTTYSGGVTTIDISTLPYPLIDGTYSILSHGGGVVPAGTYTAGVINTSTNTVSFQGNFTGAQCTLGRNYIFKYGVTTLAYKLTTAGSQRSDTEGRLQVRKFSLNYSDTGYIRAEVTPIGRPTVPWVYTGRTIGTTSATLGAYSLASGKLIIPIIARNTDVTINIINDSPLPSAMVSADWEGYYVKRSTPV